MGSWGRSGKTHTRGLGGNAGSEESGQAEHRWVAGDGTRAWPGCPRSAPSFFYFFFKLWFRGSGAGRETRHLN